MTKNHKKVLNRTFWKAERASSKYVTQSVMRMNKVTFLRWFSNSYNDKVYRISNVYKEFIEDK